MKDKEIKTKIGLIDITDKDERRDIQATVDTLNSLDKEIKKITKEFETKNALVRSFLAETLVHIVLASSRLSPSVIVSMLEKIKTTQLTGLLRTEPVKTPEYKGNYVG